MKALALATPPAVLAAAVLIALVALPGLATVGDQQVLAAALAVDFTLVLPAAVAWFWVRTGRVPWLVLIPTFVVGYAAASLTLPAGQQGALQLIKQLLVGRGLRPRRGRAR